MLGKGATTMRKIAALLAALTLSGALSTQSWADESKSAEPLTPEKAAIMSQMDALDARNRVIQDDPRLAQEALAAKRADGAEHDRAAKDYVPDNTPPPMGIFDDGEAPAPGTVFLGENRWVGVVDGVTYSVNAGRDGSNESTGRLLILKLDGVEGDGQRGQFLDSKGSGSLRVTAEREGLLEILSESGALYVVDVAKATWVS